MSGLVSGLAAQSVVMDGTDGEVSQLLPTLRTRRAWHAGVSLDRYDPPIARLGAAFGLFQQTNLISSWPCIDHHSTIQAASLVEKLLLQETIYGHRTC